MALPTVQERVVSRSNGLRLNTWSGEAMVFCPGCKAMQTVWLNAGALLPTRKFFEKEGRVYHDCGSAEPCRLYPNLRDSS